MKPYQNSRIGFELNIPDQWTMPPSGEVKLASVEYSLAFACQYFESFNIQIGPLKAEPSVTQTEDRFRKYVERSGYTDLMFGRIMVDGREHLWARYYLGSGKWNKKYLLVFAGIEYAITAACFYQNMLLEREQVWDAVVSTFRLLVHPEPHTAPDHATAEKPAPVEAESAADEAFAPILIHAPIKRPGLVQLKDSGKPQDPEAVVNFYEQMLKFVDRRRMPREWSEFQLNLGEAYRERVVGERNANLARARDHYLLALEVATLESDPETWAAAHNNLGIVYTHTNEGSRAENVEQAIEHYHQALKVYRFETHLAEWAMVQNNLGTAYQRRVKGSRADNQEQAIACFREALKVLLRPADREQRAETYYNLAFCYWERLNGIRDENIEQVIDCCKEALDYYTRDHFPYDWAVLHLRLAAAFEACPRGNRMDNLVQAVYHQERTLEIFTRQSHPEKWAFAHFTIGRLSLEVEETHPRMMGLIKIEEIIEHLSMALQVYTKHSTPMNWALTQYWLGCAYQARAQGSRLDNLKAAQKHFQEALSVLSRQIAPDQWAQVMIGLATIDAVRSDGHKDHNLDCAIKRYQQVLEYYTRKTHPNNWALGQIFIGLTYIDRQSGDRSSNLDQAEQYFRLAMGAINQRDHPGEWSRLQESLALVARERQLRPPQPNFGLTYPECYEMEASQQPGEKRTLKLIYAAVPEMPYQNNLLLVYQWQGTLSDEEANRVFLRTVAFVACAIYDAAQCVNLSCELSPIPNGRRPAWILKGESIPISLTLSDIGLEDNTCQLSVGPVMVMVHKLPNDTRNLKKLLDGFEKKFGEIYV